MPVVAVIGASIGASIGGSIIGGVMGSVIGGAIGGGLGGGIGSVMMGGSFSDGFKSGAIGGALGGAIGGYFGAGASASEFMAADAAQLAEQGLSASQIAETLGYTGAGAGEIATALESIGLDPTFASDAGNYGAAQYANAGQVTTPGQTELASIFNQNAQTPQGMDNPAVTTYGLNTPEITTSTMPDSMAGVDSDFLNGSNSYLSGGTQGPAVNVEGMTTPTSGQATQLSEIGTSPSIEGMGTLQPTSGGSVQSAGSSSDPFASTRTFGSTLKRSLSDLMPSSMSKQQQMQLGMAGMQSVQDYMNAQTLQEQADAANQPYKQYMDTINNPDKYWDQYLAGGGGESINKASRAYAKSGRTGILPSLYTQQYQNFINNSLPQMRQGLQGAGNMASANMQQQMYPMAMRQRGSSYIPQVLSSMYYKGGK